MYICMIFVWIYYDNDEDDDDWHANTPQHVSAYIYNCITYRGSFTKKLANTYHRMRFFFCRAFERQRLYKWFKIKGGLFIIVIFFLVVFHVVYRCWMAILLDSIYYKLFEDSRPYTYFFCMWVYVCNNDPDRGSAEMKEKKNRSACRNS